MKTETPKTYAAFHRIGVAIPEASRSTLAAKLAALEMKTLGDLTTFFLTAEGAVDALKPLIAQYKLQRAGQGSGLKSQRKAAIDAVKKMTPEQIAQVLNRSRFDEVLETTNQKI